MPNILVTKSGPDKFQFHSSGCSQIGPYCNSCNQQNEKAKMHLSRESKKYASFRNMTYAEILLEASDVDIVALSHKLAIGCILNIREMIDLELFKSQLKCENSTARADAEDMNSCCEDGDSFCKEDGGGSDIEADNDNDGDIYVNCSDEDDDAVMSEGGQFTYCTLVH